MPRFLVTIDEKEFDVNLVETDGGFEVTVNGSKHSVISNQLGNNRFLMLYDNAPSEVEIRSNGYSSSSNLFLAGHEMNGTIEDYKLAQLQKAMGISNKPSMDKLLRATMPGMVLDVKVKVGDTVKKGDPLLIIEAMKMENVIKAPGDAVIKSIFAQRGKSVDKGDKLLEFE